MSKLQAEQEYSIPNSKWLQKLLKHRAKSMKETIQDYTNRGYETDFDIKYNQECKNDLEILTPVIKQCIKSGKYVILTKTQWDGILNIIDKIHGIGCSFDSTYWDTNSKFFDISPRLKNWHSLDKYVDLFESGLKGSSYEQWMQCVEGVCDCSEEEMIAFPSVISPPTISEEEWKKCAEVGFIGRDKDEDYLCPYEGCNKSITQADHGDHKIVDVRNAMVCFGCDKGVEPHHIIWPITLNAKQRQNLRYALRYSIDEYEHAVTDEDYYKNDEGKVDELWKTRDALELKLMKNARHKLRSSDSRKILIDPYTLAILRHLCDQFIKTEEPTEYTEEWGKIVDTLGEIREIIDRFPLVGKPLCCECAESERR